jgi:hypothetical protein
MGGGTGPRGSVTAPILDSIVERARLGVQSPRLQRCPSSEVAGMIEGVLRYDAEMEI